MASSCLIAYFYSIIVFIKRVSIIGILSFQISHHPDEFAIVIPDVSFCPSHRGGDNLVEFTITTYQKLNIFFFCDESSDNGSNLFFCIEEAVDLAVTEEGHRENIKHARHHPFTFTDFEWTCFILIRFPWFKELPSPEEIKAYSHFIAALCEMALNQKRITAKEKPVDNDKYAFRCFLLRLGFIGEDYKAERKILLRNLSGSSAFKSGAKKTGVESCE